MKLLYIAAVLAAGTQALNSLRGITEDTELSPEQVNILKNFKNAAGDVITNIPYALAEKDNVNGITDSNHKLSNSNGGNIKPENKKQSSSNSVGKNKNKKQNTNLKQEDTGTILKANSQSDPTNSKSGQCAYFSIKPGNITEPIVIMTPFEKKPYLTWTITNNLFRVELSPGIDQNRLAGGSKQIEDFKLPKAEFKLSAYIGTSLRSSGYVSTKSIALQYKPTKGNSKVLFVANVFEPSATLKKSNSIELHKLSDCEPLTNNRFRRLAQGEYESDTNNTQSNSTSANNSLGLNADQIKQMSELKPGEILLFDPNNPDRLGQILDFNLEKKHLGMR